MKSARARASRTCSSWTFDYNNFVELIMRKLYRKGAKMLHDQFIIKCWVCCANECLAYGNRFGRITSQLNQYLSIVYRKPNSTKRPIAASWIPRAKFISSCLLSACSNIRIPCHSLGHETSPICMLFSSVLSVHTHGMRSLWSVEHEFLWKLCLFTTTCRTVRKSLFACERQ